MSYQMLRIPKLVFVKLTCLKQYYTMKEHGLRFDLRNEFHFSYFHGAMNNSGSRAK